jgi:hypothetical protein
LEWRAFVQVESQIVDIASREPAVVLADRRRSSGTIDFEDLGGDAGPRLVQRMLEEIAADLVQEPQQTGL